MNLSRIGTISVCALALTACASTNLVSTWRDPAVSQVRFSKVLAVAMVRSEARRRAVEDRMVADLARHGTQATPSYVLIPAADTRNLDAVKAAVLQGGFDGAVTWRTVADREVTHYVPGGNGIPIVGYPGFWGYYDLGWATAYDPGYLQTDRIVRVETMVYRVTAESDKLIWAGMSDTVDPGSLDRLVDGVSHATVQSMRDSGMLARRP